MTRVGATSRLANVRQEVGHRFKGTTHKERAAINYRGNI
jgi:hypothetical protein